MKLTAAQLLNFLSSAAEVTSESDDLDREERTRCAVLAEKLAALAEEYPGELELALQCACANGLDKQFDLPEPGIGNPVAGDDADVAVQIDALRLEAGAAGDVAQVKQCESALRCGIGAEWDACVEVIDAARMMEDDAAFDDEHRRAELEVMEDDDA